MEAGPTDREGFIEWTGATTLGALATALLSAKIINGAWITCFAEALTRLETHELLRSLDVVDEPRVTLKHDVMNLPDAFAGKATTTVIHRFVVPANAFARMSEQLVHEAQAQRAAGGGARGLSSVGGWRGIEQPFPFADAASCQREWYARSGLLDALREAMSVIGCAHDGSRHVAGWINANGPHAFNALHDHGMTVEWTFVLFVDPGAACVSAASSRGAADPTRDNLSGALLLRTGSPTHDGHWLSIPPAPGELWALPGHVEHCVMPRVIPISMGETPISRRDGNSHQGRTTEPAPTSSMRVSVAVNVYRPGCVPPSRS